MAILQTFRMFRKNSYAMSLDTLHASKIIHDTVFTKGESAYDLVYKIDYMYQNAWTRLIATGAIIMTIATIVIPYFISLQRKKQAILEREKDRVFVSKEVERRISEELVKFSNEVQKELDNVKSASFFLLAESKMDKKDYPYAFINFVTSIRYAIGANDLGNIKGVLDKMTIECIPNMTVQGLKTTERLYSFRIEDFLKEIESFDKDHILFSEINKFREAIGAIVLQQEKKEG